MKTCKRIWIWGKKAYASLVHHKFTTLAGALTFFLILSLVPSTFWLVLLFGQTGLHAEEILDLELFDWAKELLLYLKNNAVDASAGAGIFFIGTTLWSSSAFLYHLRRSGEIIYASERKRHGWKVRLTAIAFTLCVLLFFAASGAVLVFTGRFSRHLPKPLAYAVTYSVLLAVGFLGAWLLNAYVCPYRCSPKDTLRGSLLTAGAWLIASVLFLFYVHFGNRERLYGALSLLIVFFLWLYWMMICFTAGVIYNRHRMALHTMEERS